MGVICWSTEYRVEVSNSSNSRECDDEADSNYEYSSNSSCSGSSEYADEAKAEEIVKNSPCIDNVSIDDTLKDKIRIRSQRDLGWQVFKEDDQFDVERAFLMNKSMQLRFRWHVNAEGVITPDGTRAESLCVK